MREGLPPGPSSPAPVQTWGLLVKPIEFFDRNSERDAPETIVRRNVTLAPKQGTPALLTSRR